jgi:hypothetical protein
MSEAEDFSGTEKGNLYALEAKALMGAAMDAYEEGDHEKFEALKQLADEANEKAIIETHKELTDEE